MGDNLRMRDLELLDGMNSNIQMRKKKVAVRVHGLPAPLGMALDENHLIVDFGD